MYMLNIVVFLFPLHYCMNKSERMCLESADTKKGISVSIGKLN